MKPGFKGPRNLRWSLGSVMASRPKDVRVLVEGLSHLLVSLRVSMRAYRLSNLIVSYGPRALAVSYGLRVIGS